MVVVGVYASVTFWNQLLVMVKAGVGPLLVLIGAFIVWLETDEWKMRRQQKRESQGLQREFQPRRRVEREEEEEEEDYSELLSGTVDEVRSRVREMENPDYRAILEAEQEGKDRKTVREFLERRME